MDKYKNSDIKPFVFSDLQGSHVVTQPKPENFEFKNLNGKSLNSEKPAEGTLRIERKFEKDRSFKIDQIVRDHRGISEQESDDLEERVAAEVEKRVQEIYKNAFEQGLSEGRAEGINQVQAESVEKMNTLSSEVAHFLENFNHQMELATKDHKIEMIKFVKQFAKWVLLKEMNEQEYLTQLLEKLLHELNARRNMIIRVNEKSYPMMPAIVSQLEGKLGTFSNVRIEVSNDMHYPGVILESENGIIDASMENVFSKLDRFFEQVGSGE